jgi:hypothetical protein
MSLDSSIAALRSKIDIDELINYDIVKRFSATTDWGLHNIKMWRVTPGKERSPGVSRWRWILFDDDASFGVPTADSIGKLIPPVSYMPVAKMMENASFRSDYLQRFAVYLNTVFDPTRLTSIVDGLSQEIEGELPRYWRFLGGAYTGQIDGWKTAISNLRVFAEQRAGYVRSFLEQHYSLPPSVTLSLSVSAVDGSFAINDVVVGSEYTGKHFAGVPIRIKAIPNKNVAFRGWSNSRTSPEITLQLITDTNLSASMFPLEDKIVINEVHYSPLAGVDQQFIEIYNKDSAPRALDQYSFTSGIRHTFASGTVIPGNGYLVLVKNKSAISAMVPTGVAVVQWDQGTLSARGDAIVLRDAPGTGKVVDSIRYLPSAPWADAPLRFNSSLQLVNPNVDGSYLHLWKAIAQGGLGSAFTRGSINSIYLNEECQRDSQGIPIPDPNTCLERPGDTDLSGTLSTLDITLMRRVILGTAVLPRIAVKNAASVVESRDALTTADITIVRRCILGFDLNPSGLCRK